MKKHEQIHNHLESVAEGYDYDADNVQNLIYEEIVGDN